MTPRSKKTKIALTTDEVIAPFPKLVLDTHIITFDQDERDGWFHWEVYTRNPTRGIGGGSSPTFASALETATKEYNITIRF
jgi:hypothetical protein